MTYFNSQNPWYSEDKFIINTKIIWKSIKKMVVLNIFFLSNSENIALLLSTISVVDAKIGIWD